MHLVPALAAHLSRDLAINPLASWTTCPLIPQKPSQDLLEAIQARPRDECPRHFLQHIDEPRMQRVREMRRRDQDSQQKFDIISPARFKICFPQSYLQLPQQCTLHTGCRRERAQNHRAIYRSC